MFHDEIKVQQAKLKQTSCPVLFVSDLPFHISLLLCVCVSMSAICLVYHSPKTDFMNLISPMVEGLPVLIRSVRVGN